jgi:hypothetical protein
MACTFLSLALVAGSLGQLQTGGPQVGPPRMFQGPQVSPKALDFGAETVGQVSGSQTVQITNPGPNALTLVDARLVGPAAGNFLLQNFPPSGLTLRPGAKRSLQVQFAPGAKGLLGASLELDAGIGAPGIVTLPLTGHSLGLPGSEILIDVGGPGLFDGAGSEWLPDYGCVNGKPLFLTGPIAGTDDDTLFQTYREGKGLFYALPIAAGNYQVTLHFVEPVATAAGQRVMLVRAEEQLIEPSLDLFAEVGGHAAHTETFLTTIVDGTFDLVLFGAVGEAVLSGVSVRALPLLDVDPPTVQFGAVGGGQTVAQNLTLTNFGGLDLTLTSLALQLGDGEDASAFSATFAGQTFQGSDSDQLFPVSATLAPMASMPLLVEFSPTVADLEKARLQLAGNFGATVIELEGLGGHEGHPFLHVVIEGPSILVDYDSSGSEPAVFDGTSSHTHEPGFLLTAQQWYLNGSAAGTGQTAQLDLVLGPNLVELEIFDNHQPPDHLRGGVDVQVVAIDTVPGVLVHYFDFTGNNPVTALGGPLPLPVHGDVTETFRVLNTGAIGSSTLTGPAVVRMRADVNLTQSGSYTIQGIGGAARLLTLDGQVLSGPKTLSAGIHSLEAQFAVQNLSQLPLEVTVAQGGGPATGFGAGALTHDETALAPTINEMPTLGNSLGGNDIEIRGLGYFPADQVVVHWGAQDFAASDFLEFTPNRIRFLSPPGQGPIQVTVETPNGLSNVRTYVYDANGPVPINFANGTDVYLPSQPTCGEFGPDGRFYVGLKSGQLAAIEFDAAYVAQSVTLYPGVSSLVNREIMGLCFNPFDAATPVRVYVSHTKLFADGGAAIPPGSFSTYHGAVSVLSGPNFDQPSPLLSGLPTSNHDHATNGLVFDHNGDLLLSVGSNTNAGVAHPNSGDLPESPLSGAVIVARTSRPDFSGAVSYLETASQLPNSNQLFGEVVDVAPGSHVEVYAAGVRNAFGLELHSNGRVYTTDNGPNFGFGPASTGPNTQVADPYSWDELLLIEPGNYYGHPNRNRGRSDPRQNVYRTPDLPDVPGVYQGPLGVIPSSQNGVDEYRSDTFGGQLRGNLITQKWANTPRRLVLSADGRAMTQELQIYPWTGALQTVTGPGGVLLPIDYYGQRIQVLKPVDLAAVGLVVHDVTPWRAPATGGTPFVIAGVGFGDLGNTRVFFGSAQATLTAVSATRIRGLIPAQAAPTTALLDVRVEVGVKQDIHAKAFRYLLPVGTEPGQWKTGAEVPTYLGEVAAVALGKELHVLGEYDARTAILDLDTLTWTFDSAFRPFRGSHHAAEVIGGKLYLIGGLDFGSEGKLQIYDPATRQWTLGADLPWAGGSVCTAAIGGKIYACGGIVGTFTVENFAVYDPATNLWTALPALAPGTGRNHAAAGTDGKKFYIFGGRRLGNWVGPGYADVFVYDPALGTWQSSLDPGSTLPPLPVARGGMGKAVYRAGRFYVIGGETDTPTAETVNGAYGRVDVFDPVQRTWSVDAPLPTPRHGIFPVLFESRIFVAAGGVKAGASNSKVFEYFESH